MNLNTDFRTYCTRYFSRLVGGYMRALDSTYVRAWLPGHLSPSDAGGAVDATTRMLPALAAWVASKRSAYAMSARGEPVDVAAHVRTVFANAFDPAHPGFWGAGTPHPGVEFDGVHQHTVEAASLAYAAWLLRATLLPTLPAEVVGRFRAWLEYFGRRAHTNNWQLFLIVNHAARRALGWDFDQAVIDRGWDIINSYERADGWMTDGPEGYYDDYNWWVFGTHELMWVQMTGEEAGGRRQKAEEQLADRILARTRKRLEEYPYFFGADGSYCEYGRSLSYKFARLALPVMAYRMGIWPHSAGMLQRLVRRHLAWYDDRGGIDRVSDTVRQELTAHGSPDVREPYINTGHPYWCMLAFAALWQVPEGDPLWMCKEEPLPVEVGDFTRTIKPAGWILEGVQKGGHVLRYALGSRHAEATYAPFQAKYSKFCYGSHFPPILGRDCDCHFDDAALILNEFGRSHPGCYEGLIVGEGFVSARYELSSPGLRVPVRTTLVPFGEICVRIHSIVAPKGRPSFLEGAPALGFSPGERPDTLFNGEWTRPGVAPQPSEHKIFNAAFIGSRATAIYGHWGYRGWTVSPAVVDARGRHATMFDAYVPALAFSLLEGENHVVSITLATLSGFREFWKEVSFTHTVDGFRIACGPRAVVLPRELPVPL